MATSLVDMGLLEMEKAAFVSLVTAKVEDGDEDWLKANYEYCKQIDDNPPNDLSKEMRKTLAGRCYGLEVVVSLASDRKLQQGGSSGRSQPARAQIDLGVKDEALSHDFDLRNFEKRVAALLKWRESREERKVYLAPYLVVIQSSGMGKTKLLYEYMKKKKKEGADSKIGDVKLLLCINRYTDVGETVHEKFMVPISQPTAAERVKFISQLDGILAKATKGKTLVLLVDEAQHLISTNMDDVTCGNEGFYFRCFRSWLQMKDRNVVAVFAGTTIKLSNLFEERRAATFSRGLSDYHEERGTKLYEPFFELTTSGAGKKDTAQIIDQEDEDCHTDFMKSIPYGRPLFHVMKKEKRLDDAALKSIKERLLLHQHLPVTHASSWLSVLSVRVQMGQTTSAIVSSLVAHGYANLTHFQYLPDQKEGAIVQHCHFPDPVLARASMQIMNEDPRERKKWSWRAMTLFSSGLCTPAKGGIGVVAAALYMLFCGDEIRKTKDPSFKTFAVPLQEWLDGMGATPIIRSGDNHEEGKSLSFIQFCRSYVRLTPGEIAANQKFLEELHRAAYGIYLDPGAEACDILAAVSCHPNSKCAMDVESPKDRGFVGVQAKKSCEALLVSVKDQQEFGCADMGQALGKMMKQLLDFGLEKGGICLLILVGLADDKPLTKVEVAAVKAEIELEIMKPRTRSSRKRPGYGDMSSISSYVVIVKKDDKYGVGEMLQCTTCPGGERSEVYSSHFSLEKLVGSKDRAGSVLRAGPWNSDKGKDEGLEYTIDLWKALSGAPSPHKEEKVSRCTSALKEEKVECSIC